MKITAGMIALNAEATIEAAISSIAPYVDEVIVLCGVVEDYAKVNPTMVAADNSCFNIDRTVYIVDKMIDTGEFNRFNTNIKLVFSHSMFPTKTEMQNELMFHVANDTDIFFKLDADEIIEPKSFLKAIELFNDPEVLVVGMPYFHYWKSLYLNVIGEGWNNTPCKLYRYSPGMHYSKSKFIPDGFNTIFDNKSMQYINEIHRGFRVSDCYVHHLGYVLHSDAVIQAKIKYYKHRGIEEEVIDGYTNWLPGDKAIINTTSPGDVVPMPREDEIDYPEEIIKLRFKHSTDGFTRSGEL